MSTVHALIDMVRRLKYALRSTGSMIRILLVDFSKTFDRVGHHNMLTKCASLGLPHFVIKRIISFLCQRKHRVKIGSIKLKYATIHAGVSHGTQFGPIGFVHHVNDLRTTCDTVKYVDDGTLWEACSPSRFGSSLYIAADEVAQRTTTN